MSKRIGVIMIIQEVLIFSVFFFFNTELKSIVIMKT